MSQVTVEVAPATYDACQKVAALVLAVKSALAGGFTVGQSLPAIMEAAIADLAPVLQEVSQIKAEAAGDKFQLASAVELGGQAIVAAVLA